MLTSSQRNLCFRIALGEEKIDNLDRVLTSEELEEIEFDKEEIEMYKNAGPEDVLEDFDTDI